MKYTNKIFQTAILALLALSFPACDNFFDIDLKNGISESDFYKTTHDLNSAAYGMYAALAPQVHQFMLWGSARADLVTNGSETDPFVTEFVNNNVTEINPYTNYSFLYRTIARANQQLANLYKVKPDGTNTQDYLNSFYGEAYFVRALCYFWLVRTYSNVPLIEEDIANTLTYKDSQGNTITSRTLTLSDEDIRAIALQPAKEQKIWSLIQSDLTRCLQLMRNDPQWLLNGYSMPAELHKIRASITAATTLAAEVALWLGQYDKAVSYSNAATGRTSLGNTGDWASQFTGNITNGQTYTCFSLAYEYTNGKETNRLQEFTSNIEADGGRYLLKPAINQFNKIFNETKDCRRVSVMRVNRKDLIWKYIGMDTEGESMREPYESSASFHLIKTADAFFWRAIAENRLGNHDAAFQIYNSIRKTRGLEEAKDDATTKSIEGLEKLLFLEHARETAFEGRRWYDLLLMETRLGHSGIISETVSQKYLDETQKAEIKTRLSNPANWYLPIKPELWK